MSSQQVILLVLNVLGGAAVLRSYVSGSGFSLVGQCPVGRRAGGRPAGYTVSMLLSAVATWWFFLPAVQRITVRNYHSRGSLASISSIAVFGPYPDTLRLWMPLTNGYIGHGSPALWLGIRVVLICRRGLAAAALAWALFSAGIGRRLALAGGHRRRIFCFHTLILDAIICLVVQ
jgi:hypothetical protein